MDSDFFKSDFLTSNLQPINGSKLNFGVGKYGGGDLGGFGGLNLGQPNDMEKKRAGEFVSSLLNRQKEMSG